MFPTLYSLRLIFYRSEWPDETDFVTDFQDSKCQKFSEPLMVS